MVKVGGDGEDKGTSPTKTHRREAACITMSSSETVKSGTGSSSASSLNCSIEKLNSVDTTSSKAKLGDTRDLEDFIADLDQTLAEMM
ncbi:hypothetical protein chiPu_0019683 [Chiloscyllium punctatum]|uniref:Uncharacterized protein n=1 Tax=Chiloscyllium punctatum TaxID=137246 RepID=A0A401RSW1_CHIPU|nr:hypothetical protein [Chiloscyllium punctatum]